MKVLGKIFYWIGRGLLALLSFVVLLCAMLFQWGNERWKKLKPITQQAIAIAVLIHLVVLIVAAFVVAVEGRRAPPKIVATVVDQPVVVNLQQRRLSAVKQLKQVQASSASAMSRMVLAKTEASISLPQTDFDVRTISMQPGSGTLGLGNGFGQGMGRGSGGGGAFPIEVRGRCVPGERKRLLRENGGVPEVEGAVTRALDWLKKEQNRDGTWGEKYESAMTGLALLCYFGRCETTTSKDYGETVTKGIQAILEMGETNPSGFLYRNEATKAVYEQGIATYALGEGLAMSKGIEPVPGMRNAFINGVKKIIAGQTSDGGWAYEYEQRSGDLSVAGWQVQALKAAKRNNIHIEGLDACMARAADFFAGRQSDVGGFGYQTTGNRSSLIGVAVLSLQFLGRPSRQIAEKGFEYYFTSVDEFDYFDRCDLYEAYYMNQATFNHGGDYWTRWNDQCRDELLSAQLASGEFPVEGGKSSVHYTGTKDAAVYRTTLSTLMLEVYYRYLPVNRL